MKKVIIPLIVLFFSFSIFAEYVSFEEARLIADHWTIQLRDHFNDQVVVTSGEAIVREGTTVAYVFHFSPQGYVMVSAQDYLPPVKMYSLKNDFAKEGKELEEMVFNSNLEIINNVNASIIDPGRYFAQKNKRDFRILKGVSFPFSMTADRAAEVQPLVATTWSQGEPYNLMCPMLNGERSVTGCVATAFAQIMKYYQYPESGQGSYSYQTETHNIPVSTSFDHPYYWERMLNNYPGADSGTDEERDAIAQLMFDVGVALNMDYSPEGSGANSTQAVATFPIFFNYSQDILFVSRFGMIDAEWFHLAKIHLDRGLPVAFAIYRVGMGHMVVIDGYRILNESTTFHINMGWGGSYDAYYALNNIVVRDDRHYTVLEWQSYILNMVPPRWRPELPPLSFGASAHENRSFLRSEYFCELTWKGVLGWDADIDRYVIYRYDRNTWEQSFLAEVDHTGQADIYRYTFRYHEFTPEAYTVYAVTHGGEWRLLLYCNLILRE